jgi:hypothetical protein
MLHGLHNDHQISRKAISRRRSLSASVTEALAWKPHDHARSRTPTAAVTKSHLHISRRRTPTSSVTRTHPVETYVKNQSDVFLF